MREEVGALCQARRALRGAVVVGDGGLSGLPDWPAVIAPYDHLYAITGSPVVALNRAVARAELAGPRDALAELEPLERDARMVSYQPYWAAKGHLLARAGDSVRATEALTVAIGLTTEEAVREYLRRRLASL